MNRYLRLTLLVAFAMLLALLLMANAAAQDNGDFSLQLNVDGDDLSEAGTIVIHPGQELTIGLHIFDVRREVTLEDISVVVTFAGLPVLNFSQHLGGFNIAAGEEYRQSITVNAAEALEAGGKPLVTGIYHAVVRLEYSADGQQRFWSEAQNVRIPGNPLNTLAGWAGMVLSGATALAIFTLARSIIAPGLAAGTTMPANTPISPVQRLHDLALERLEPAARGRVMGNIVKAARGRIVKQRCPICDTRLKHGHCYTCGKSAGEVRKEYIERVKALAFQSAELLASGQAVTLDDLCSRFSISPRLGTDVIATLKKARLVKVKGVVRKVMGKALVAGIGSGLSAVLWITVGGLAALSTSVLVVILAVSVVLPVAVARSLQIQAGRALKKRRK